MKSIICSALLALFPLSALAVQPVPKFLETYKDVAKDMVPILQPTKCEAKPGKKVASKVLNTNMCQLAGAHSFLVINSVDQQVTAAWLNVAPNDLAHPSDLTRSGGMLLRAARGGGFGDYLQVSMDLFVASQRIGGKAACKDDAPSGMKMCVSKSADGTYDIMLEQK